MEMSGMSPVNSRFIISMSVIFQVTYADDGVCSAKMLVPKDVDGRAADQSHQREILKNKTHSRIYTVKIYFYYLLNRTYILIPYIPTCWRKKLHMIYEEILS